MSRTPVPAKSFDFQIIYLSGTGYVVEDRHGNRMSDGFASRKDAVTKRAELQAQADARAKRGPRACICCGNEFRSSGIHNRMCEPCRHRGGEMSSNPIVMSRRNRAA